MYKYGNRGNPETSKWLVDNRNSQRKSGQKIQAEEFQGCASIFTNYRQILVFTGLRRVGKSTIMYQLINDLISSISPLKIIYFSFDFGSEELQLILREYQKITKID